MKIKIKTNVKELKLPTEKIEQASLYSDVDSHQPIPPHNVSARRKLLKGLVVSSGVIVSAKLAPETWTKPIINAVILPSHAQTSEIDPPMCETCLVEAIYCEGSGMNSITVEVSTDGTVIITHPNGTRTVTIDPCTGGEFATTVESNGGNTINLSGSVPCGDVDSIEFVEVNGVTTNNLTLFQNLCVS